MKNKPEAETEPLLPFEGGGDERWGAGDGVHVSETKNGTVFEGLVPNECPQCELGNIKCPNCKKKEARR